VLREWLTADAGHLSRVLARFEREGMVTRVCSGTDHRRQQVTLTALGIQRRAALGVIVAEAARTHSPLGRSPLDDSGRSPATSIRVNPA
jgi:DNA-binding MarR family transcriptional regulator